MADTLADVTTIHDFRRFRGSTKVIVLELTNDTNDLDITGWAFALAVDRKPRPAPPSGSTLFTLAGTITNAVQTSASDPCTVEFAPSSGNVDQEPGDYYYDVEQTDAAGKTDITLKGRFVFAQGINV